ncbi:MAG: presenilin family intramembrane aspartyl protease [Dehalococcoidia bacterium]|nr:presenilin family intramembrane aspartyl protease [Dehalococcoidia bacterium]MDH4300162.1 presenilin family intramembrane aspartyl protease [Dehalococcoidia bacterium]MDH4367929.1 presenilin family intramembrane aspartyl protease [Dehalococcoidia bacterium]
MSTKRPVKLNTAYLGLILFVVAQMLILLVAPRIDPFLDENDIEIPTQPPAPIAWWPGEVTLPSGEVIDVPANSALGPILIYIFAAVLVLGITLYKIPLAALKVLLRILFALLFSWGAFIATVFYLPFPVAVAIAVAFGTFWFLIPLVWLHNLVLILAVSSVGVVFGRFITPWTAMAIILALAVYDFLAVRFKLMLWMADRLSEVNALPALIIPKKYSEWNSNLKKHGEKVVELNPAAREYSILGGGDIAFPCLLTASVYFAQGFRPAAIMAVLGLLGLVSVYVIQTIFLKGKPMPALPPIAAFTLVGLLII